VKQFSEESYRELLWHLLLRGHDSFFLWCRSEEIGAEIRPLHEVWLSALEYKEFLDRGTPVTFDVPKAAGPVVSGLRLGNRLLVRRTDFSRGAGAGAVLSVDGRKIEIPPSRGRCQILVLPTTGGPDMQKG
jgi:hypothetical protein